MTNENLLIRVPDQSPFTPCRPRHLRSPSDEWMGKALHMLASLAIRAMDAIPKRSVSATAPSDACSNRSQWLSPRAPLVLPASDHQTITCNVGTVWITQGDSTDYVLSAGGTVVLQPKEDVIVSAMRGPALINRTSSF